MHKPCLLIFGELAPLVTNAAIATMQTALFAEHFASVTIVIADHAPVPEKLPETIELLRHRDLPDLPPEQQKAARLYILGDTIHSLDTFQLYLQFPGSVIVTDKSLFRLFSIHLKTEKNWPHNYTNWLNTTFGNKAEMIALALLRQKRESKSIADEIPLELVFPDIAKNQVALPTFAEHYPVSPSIIPAFTNTAPESTSHKILLIGKSNGTQAAAKNLRTLGKNITLIERTGGSPDLSAEIALADLIIIAEGKRRFPTYMLAVIAHGKAFITAGQRWAKLITAQGFYTLTPDAEQSLTAALGSFVAHPSIRSWLHKHTLALQSRIKDIRFDSTVEQILQPCEKPLVLTDNTLVTATALAETTETEVDKLNIPKEAALIGLVPPASILADVMPTLDLPHSPKFATPALCEALKPYSDTSLPIFLSRLGYEAPILHATPEKGETLETLKNQLKQAATALCFGPPVEGALCANHVITEYLSKNNISFAVQIADALSGKAPHGHDENAGMMWWYDKIRHLVSCVFLLGIPGRYKLSVAGGVPITVATKAATHRLSKDTPLNLEADPNGILFFSLSLEHTSKELINCSEILTKSLADYPLNLEWLDHG